MVIQSFRDSRTERIWQREHVSRISVDLERRAHIKLLILNRAETLNDLRVPPGNHLEKLSGNRDGQYSIRVNKQWRICFEWGKSGPENVELTDYH